MFMRKGKVILCISAVMLVAGIGFAVVRLSGGTAESRKDTARILKDGQRDFDRGDIPGAFRNINLASVRFRERGDEDGFFESMVYLALLYDQIGQRDSAYKTLKAVGFRDVPNRKTYSSQYWLRLMGHYKAKFDKDYEAAEMYTRRAIDFSRKNYPGDAAYMYMDMANLAELHIMSGKTDSAWAAVERLKRLRPVKYNLYLSEMYYCTGRLYHDVHKTDSARRYFGLSLEWSRKYSAFDNELMALDMLSRIDSASVDMYGYIQHRGQHDRLREKVKGDEIRYKIALMGERHRQQLVREENARIHAVYLLLLCVMLFIIAGLAASVAYVHKTARTRRKMNDLEHDRLDVIVGRDRLEKELLRLKIDKQDKALTHAYKENLVMGLKLAEYGGGMGEESPLIMVLKEMDKVFIKNVEARYPQLSKNDIRLMCLIRMGMASGEISRLLNITMDSLHKSRYRLRKKLGLQTGQELEVFINSIIAVR